MNTNRPVLVIQLPRKLNSGQARHFLSEIEPILTADRPRIVFDFSEVAQIDSAGVDMLVRSLEMVMQSDGDLKIAALTPEAGVVLELTRVDRLFEIFLTASDAVESFQGFPAHNVAANSYAWYTPAFPDNMRGERLAG